MNTTLMTPVIKQRNKNAKKQTHKKLEQTPAQPKRPAPTPEQIQKRAYEIYAARGGAPGREREDWFLAETELKIESEIGLQRAFPE